MFVRRMIRKKKGRGNEMFVPGAKMQVGQQSKAKQGAKAGCCKPAGCSAGN